MLNSMQSIILSIPYIYTVYTPTLNVAINNRDMFISEERLLLCCVEVAVQHTVSTFIWFSISWFMILT